MANFEEELISLNQRLKAAKMRVTIFVRDNHLWLRATLPPRPQSSGDKPSQQRISTGAKATITGLNYAERRAKYMSLCLDENKFDWSEWITAPSKTIGDIVTDYHNWRLKQSKIADSTFNIDYLRVSRKLPQSKKLEINLILEIIGKTAPDSRTRKRLAEYCSRLCKFAGMPEADLKKNSFNDWQLFSIKGKSAKITY